MAPSALQAAILMLDSGRGNLQIPARLIESSGRYVQNAGADRFPACAR